MHVPAAAGQLLPDLPEEVEVRLLGSLCKPMPHLHSTHAGLSSEWAAVASAEAEAGTAAEATRVPQGGVLRAEVGGGETDGQGGQGGRCHKALGTSWGCVEPQHACVDALLFSLPQEQLVGMWDFEGAGQTHHLDVTGTPDQAEAGWQLEQIEPGASGTGGDAAVFGSGAGRLRTAVFGEGDFEYKDPPHGQQPWKPRHQQRGWWLGGRAKRFANGQAVKLGGAVRQAAAECMRCGMGRYACCCGPKARITAAKMLLVAQRHVKGLISQSPLCISCTA